MDRDRLEHLISGFCDQALSQEETVELNAWLAGSEEARRQFVILMDQHRQLAEWHASGTAVGTAASREAELLASPDAFMRVLMVRYLEGTLDALGTEALQVFLQEDPKACDEFSNLALQMGKPLSPGERPVLRSPAASGSSRRAGNSSRFHAVERENGSAVSPALPLRVWMAAAAVFVVSIVGGALWWSLWLPPPVERTGSLRTERPMGSEAPVLPPAPLPPPRPLPPEPGKEILGPDLFPERRPHAEAALKAERLREQAAELQRLILSQQHWLKADLPKAGARRATTDTAEDDETVAVDPAQPANQDTETEPVPVARVVFVEPETKDVVVVRKGAGAETRTPLSNGSVLLTGDRVETRRTDDRACAAVRLDGGATVDLAGETTVQVRGVGTLRLESGRIYACYKPDLRVGEEYGPPPLALETAAGRYLTNGAQMEVFASPKVSVPAQTIAKVDSGRVHLFNSKGHVMGVRGQEVQAIALRPPAGFPALTSAVWRGRDRPFDNLPFAASTPIVVMDEDPFACLLEDYAFALSHERTRTVLGIGVGGGNNNARDRFKTLDRYARALKVRGVRNIPELLLGSGAPLVPPVSGRFEETRPESSPAVNRLVSMARQARPDRPVAVICAGAMTDLASAWLVEPACAANLIAVCGFGGPYQCEKLDPWAYTIVMQQFRCIVLDKTYAMNLDPREFDRIRDRCWSSISRKEGSRDLVLLATVALPEVATKVERATCERDGTNPLRLVPKADGRIWLVKDVQMDILRQDVQQTFFGQ
jgi:hypothetical protein